MPHPQSQHTRSRYGEAEGRDGKIDRVVNQ
jgi:hypothetical protein